MTPTLWFCYRGEQSWNKMSNDFSKFSDNCRWMSLHQNPISQASWHLTCVTRRLLFVVKIIRYFISKIEGMVNPNHTLFTCPVYHHTFCGFCSNRILHYFPLSVCPCVCHRRDISHFSHIKRHKCHVNHKGDPSNPIYSESKSSWLSF